MILSANRLLAIPLPYWVVRRMSAWIKRPKAREGGQAYAKHANRLSYRVFQVDVTDQADEGAVQAGRVHVAALGGSGNAWLDSRLETILGERDEKLLQLLALERLLVAELAELGRDLLPGALIARQLVVVV